MVGERQGEALVREVACWLCQYNRVIRSMPSEEEIQRATPLAKGLALLVLAYAREACEASFDSTNLPVSKRRACEAIMAIVDEP